jgi:hypothetical protein
MGAVGNLEGRLLSTSGAIGVRIGAVYTVVHDVECGSTYSKKRASEKSDESYKIADFPSFQEELIIYWSRLSCICNMQLTALNVQTNIYLFKATGKRIESKPISKENNYGEKILIGNNNSVSHIYLGKVITKNEATTKKLMVSKIG